MKSSILASLWHSHTITLYPFGSRRDSMEDIMEVQKIASSIAYCVDALTVCPLIYLETVPIESPARAATSRIVAAKCIPPPTHIK